MPKRRPDGKKKCKKCQLLIDLDNFYVAYKNKYGIVYCTTCKDCNKLTSVEWGRNNRHKHYGYEIKYKYGLTIKEYDEMVLAQNNKCAICQGSSVKRFSIDHCHKTGKIRGLLCFACNSAIGKLKENKELFINAINYLEKYK